MGGGVGGSASELFWRMPKGVFFLILWAKLFLYFLHVRPQDFIEVQISLHILVVLSFILFLFICHTKG